MKPDAFLCLFSGDSMERAFHQMTYLEISVTKRPDGRVRSHLSCTDSNGLGVCEISDTLLGFISNLTQKELELFSKLLLNPADRSPLESNAPDWSLDDTEVWIGRPPAQNGMVCVSNGLTPYCLEESGEQYFTTEQVVQAVDLWARHIKGVTEIGARETLGTVARVPMVGT